mgnify:CR=1 FL=1
MLFTVCSVLLFWSVALAVDGARWFSARSYHANSVDAALLAEELLSLAQNEVAFPSFCFDPAKHNPTGRPLRIPQDD